MTRVTVDFSDVPDFEAIDKGEYPAVVENVEYRDPEQTGKEYAYLNWEFTITEGEFSGRKQWMVTSFSPKALFKMKETFENLGIADEEIEVEFDEDADNMVISPEVIGLPCVLVVSKSKYQGRDTNSVDNVLPADAPTKVEKKSASKSKPSAEKKSTKKFK